MDNQKQFIGFTNAKTFNNQIRNGSRVKIFKKDGSFIEAVKIEDAKEVNKHEVCIVNIQNQLMQIDIQSIYI